ncbi:MAG: T9SS type A sorting domain-containing protein [Crocinitomicaceae bacterium]
MNYNLSIWWSDGTTNQNSIQVQPTQTTTYSVTVSDGVGTCTDSITIQVNNPQVNAGSDLSVCEGETATLTATGAETYAWDNGVINGVAFTPSATTSYTVTGTDANGCQNTDQVTVNVNALPTVNAGADQTVCAGETVTLSGSGANVYSWNNSVSNGVAFTPIATTSYTVTGTDANGCVNSDTIQVNVNTQSSSTVTINSCDSYTLNGQTFTSSGIYSQIIPNAAGCDSTITLDLTLNYSPNTPIVTIENEVNLSTSNNTGVTYQWTRCPDYTPIVGQTNSSFNPTINGLYAVVVTNGCGSDTSDCADVSTIGFSDLMQDRIQVYPNPNNGEFSIEIPSELLGQLLHIVDINGRLIKSIKVNKLVNSIDILDLARGSYWLQMDSQQPIQILKQ